VGAAVVLFNAGDECAAGGEVFLLGDEVKLVDLDNVVALGDEGALNTIDRSSATDEELDFIDALAFRLRSESRDRTVLLR